MKRSTPNALFRSRLLAMRAQHVAAIAVIDDMVESISTVHLASSPGVHPPSRSSVQGVDNTVDDGVDSWGGQHLDGRASSSESSHSPKYSEDLDQEEERRESRVRELSTRIVHPVGQQVDRAGGHASAARLAGCWDGVGGVSTSGSQRARIGEATPLIERLAKERGITPVALFDGACRRFKADPGLKAKKMCTLPVLLSQLEQWADDPNGPAAPTMTQAEREYRATLEAGEKAQAQHPGKGWDSPELSPFRERLVRAKAALDAERQQRQALS